MSWIRSLAATIRPRQLDIAIEDELEFHIEQRAADLVAQGIPPEQARRQAARLFGNRTALGESTRDRDVVVWLQSTLQDLRFASRTLRRNPGFACAAVLSLAFGIGANTALFSLIDGLALRSLPVREPAQLMRIADPEGIGFSYPPFDRLRRGTHVLKGLAATGRYSGPSRIDERGQQSTAIVQVVSDNYWDILGVSPWRGRAFHEPDARSPEGAIAVISETYWRGHYGADERAIGAHFRYGDRDFTVTGIAPPGFRGANVDGPADIWVPLEQTMPPGSPMWTKGRWLQLLDSDASAGLRKQSFRVRGDARSSRVPAGRAVGELGESLIRLGYDAVQTDNVADIQPWGEPGSANLHWFGLTPGRHWIDTLLNGHELALNG